MGSVKAIIMAGGKGTRMKSDLPKVLHKVYDRCIIDYVCESCKQAAIEDISIIVGHKYEQVIEHVKEDEVHFFIQKEQLGTGHAIMQAKEHIEDDDIIIVVNGDMPLLSPFTLKSLLTFYEQGNYGAVILSGVQDDPKSYGRVIRDSSGNLVKIVEAKDCNEYERDIKEFNVGVYLFNGGLLKSALDKLDNKNKQAEYYITDVPSIIMQLGYNVGVSVISDIDESQGINSREELAEVTKTLLIKTREKHMDNGVTLIDPNNTYISYDVEIGKDTILYPGTNIQGKTIIGSNCIIGPSSIIINSQIGDNVVVEMSKVIESKIENNAVIGPFAHLRPKTHVGNGSKIGSFVETKKIELGCNSKIPHLAYVGDADIGNNVEIACGVITSNMNAKWEKHKTVIKDNAFIGCNSVLVAPITVEECGLVGAGSTVSQDVPKHALALTRPELKVKEDYYHGRPVKK